MDTIRSVMMYMHVHQVSNMHIPCTVFCYYYSKVDTHGQLAIIVLNTCSERLKTVWKNTSRSVSQHLVYACMRFPYLVHGVISCSYMSPDNVATDVFKIVQINGGHHDIHRSCQQGWLAWVVT